MCVYLSKKKRKRTKKASKVKNVHHKKQQHCESVLGAIRIKLCRTEWRQEDNERDGTNFNKGEGLTASGVEFERVVGTCFVHFDRQTEQRAFRSDTSWTRTFAHARLSLWVGWQGTTTHIL